MKLGMMKKEAIKGGLHIGAHSLHKDSSAPPIAENPGISNNNEEVSRL